MSGHTPGPWTIYENGCINRDSNRRGGWPLATVAGCSRGWDWASEEQEANARLIAAAPEMLEALKNAVRCGERDGTREHPGSAPGWCAKARDIIAKAEGREP